MINKTTYMTVLIVFIACSLSIAAPVQKAQIPNNAAIPTKSVTPPQQAVVNASDFLKTTLDQQEKLNKSRMDTQDKLVQSRIDAYDKEVKRQMDYLTTIRTIVAAFLTLISLCIGAISVFGILKIRSWEQEAKEELTRIKKCSAEIDNIKNNIETKYTEILYNIENRYNEFLELAKLAKITLEELPNRVQLIEEIKTDKNIIAQIVDEAKEFMPAERISPQITQQIEKASEILNETPEELLSANDYFILAQQEKDNDAKLELLNKALSLDTSFVQAYFHRAFLHLYKKDFQSAEQDIAYGIKIDENNAVGYQNRGVLNILQGKYNEAIIDFNKAISLDKSKHTPYVHLALAYHEINDLDNATKNIESAIKINEKATNAYVIRARINITKGDIYNAIRDYQKAASLDNNDATIYTLLGYAFLLDKDYSRAIEANTTAIQIDPQCSQAYNNRGVAYGKINDTDRAVADFDIAISISPSEPNAYFNKACAVMNNDTPENRDVAISLLEEAVRKGYKQAHKFDDEKKNRLAPIARDPAYEGRFNIVEKKIRGFD